MFFSDGPWSPTASICLPAQANAEADQVSASPQGDHHPDNHDDDGGDDDDDDGVDYDEEEDRHHHDKDGDDDVYPIINGYDLPLSYFLAGEDHYVGYLSRIPADIIPEITIIITFILENICGESQMISMEVVIVLIIVIIITIREDIENIKNLG